MRALVTPARHPDRAGSSQLKTMSRLGLLHPDCDRPAVIFATIAFYMFRRGRRRHGDAALRRARRRDDGHLVVDALRLGRRDPVAALAGDARARVAAPPPFLVSLLGDARDLDDRPLLARRHARLGPLLFGVPLQLVHPFLFALSLPAAVALARPARDRARLDASSSTATRTRSRTCSSTRLARRPGCSCRSRSCRAGRARSPGCSRRPGASKAIREAALGGDPLAAIAMCVSGSGAVYLAHRRCPRPQLRAARAPARHAAR